MNPHVGRVPVREYVATWIAERPNLAPRSVYTYEGLVARYIEGTELGLLDLADVTAAQVRMWRADRLAAGVGEVSVAKAYRLLRAAFNTAVDDGLIGRNPCRIVGAGIRDLVPLGSAARVEQRFRNRYLPSQQHYFDTVRPTDLADIVVHNDEPERPAWEVRPH